MNIDVLLLLESNLEEEAKAVKNYYYLLNTELQESDKEKIKEIIRDELDHQIILQKLNEKYSKIYPAEFSAFNKLKNI